VFPPIEPFASGNLAVCDVHTLHWEQVGTPSGVPILFLHGGPGSGCVPRHRQFFDPALACVTLFDQRGCGRSTPLAQTRNNTTAHLISDIEALRIELGVEKWIVFGGSWGSTLALAYGQAHPDRCLGFVLRGIFLGTPPEIDWFVHDMRRFFPDAGEAFLSFLPEHERTDLLGSYLRRMSHPDPTIHQPAATSWARYEGACATLHPSTPDEDTPAIRHFERGIATMEAHYMANACFLAPDQLLHGVAKIAHLPCTIVQGRYDVICPPETAWKLHRAWAGSKFVWVNDAGHSASEPGIATALVTETAALVARVRAGALKR
jgi:proline iminopeptidase